MKYFWYIIIFGQTDLVYLYIKERSRLEWDQAGLGENVWFLKCPVVIVAGPQDMWCIYEYCKYRYFISICKYFDVRGPGDGIIMRQIPQQTIWVYFLRSRIYRGSVYWWILLLHMLHMLLHWQGVARILRHYILWLVFLAV